VKLTKLQIVAGVLVVGFLLLMQVVKVWTLRRETTQYLEQIASDLNRGLPAMQDGATRAERVSVGPGENLTFTFTLVNAKDGELSAGAVSDFLTGFKKQKCASATVRDVLSRGAGVNFKWQKADRRTPVADLALTASACQAN